MYKLSSILNSLGYIVRTFLEILVSLLLTIIIGPIFFTVWFLNEIARQFVSLLLWAKFGNKVSLVEQGDDNIWHYKKPGNNRMCVIALFSDDPANDLQSQRDKFLNQVILKELPCGKRPYEKLTKTFVKKFGYDCFQKDYFDIANHVRMYDESTNSSSDPDTPNPNNGCYSEDEFLNIILPQLATDMDETKPQWEEVIISKVKCNDSDKPQTVFCLRYHHG